MLRVEHEHTDTDPISLHLTMECVKLAVTLWGGWYGRSSAKADAAGEMAPPVVRLVCELLATFRARKRRYIFTSSIQKPA